MADPRGDVREAKPLGGEVWTIEAGEQKWRVHEELLCKNSAFFRSAVKKEWDQDKEKIISLPDDEAAIVQVYIQWLYRDKILIRKGNEPLKTLKDFEPLLKGYIFGEKIQDVAFQNTIIDSILAAVDEEEKGTRWFPTDIDTVYEGTPEGSPLRMLMVDMFVYHGNPGWIESPDSVPFLVDLAKRLLDRRPRPSGLSPVSRKSSSVYHKPVDEADKEPTKTEDK